MSTLHLAAGSEKPAEVKGQVRLYSMKYCPFAHRIRLMLSFKHIPHDIVNINLQNKPKWYSEVHPEGKVPAFIDADGNLITDFMEVANYLDKLCPEPPLCRQETNERDNELIDHYSQVVRIFSDSIDDNDDRPFDEIVAEISDLLIEFEEELAARGSTFFGGNQPGIVDVAMWPWTERAQALPLIYRKPVKNFKKENFPHIMKWIARMRELPAVQENAGSYERFAQFVEDTKAGRVNYDKLRASLCIHTKLPSPHTCDT